MIGPSMATDYYAQRVLATVGTMLWMVGGELARVCAN